MMHGSFATLESISKYKHILTSILDNSAVFLRQHFDVEEFLSAMSYSPYDSLQARQLLEIGLEGQTWFSRRVSS